MTKTATLAKGIKSFMIKYLTMIPNKKTAQVTGETEEWFKKLIKQHETVLWYRLKKLVYY